jgi:hypothetical protein
MNHCTNERPKANTIRQLVLAGALALGCGAMTASCSTVSGWWHNMTGTGSSATNTSYNTSSNYNQTAANGNMTAPAATANSSAPEASQSSAAAAMNETNRPVAANENNQPAETGSRTAAAGPEAENMNGAPSTGIHSMKQATHYANEQEARAAAEEFAPQLKADIDHAQGRGMNVEHARDLYQRGQEAMNSGHAVRALRDFNRAERSIQSMNTSASAR